jgi:hypothetical protein
MNARDFLSRESLCNSLGSVSTWEAQTIQAARGAQRHLAARIVVLLQAKSRRSIEPTVEVVEHCH